MVVVYAVPLGIPHSTQQDAELCGFTIPCETVVICNHQAVHLNEASWNNPCEFDPERFLDDDCDQPRLIRCVNNFLPFGLGNSPTTAVILPQTWLCVSCCRFFTVICYVYSDPATLA